MQFRGSSFNIFFGHVFLVSALSASGAWALDVTLPCGGSKYPECGKFTAQFKKTVDEVMSRQMNALKLGNWLRYELKADGSHEEVNEKIAKPPFCAWAKLDVPGAPGCKDTRLNDFSGASCGPQPAIMSYADGSWKSRLKHGGYSGPATAHITGSIFVALADQYRTASSQAVGAQTISVPSGSGCSSAAVALNTVIKKLENAPNLELMMKGCGKASDASELPCPAQHELEGAYVHLQLAFLGLAQCQFTDGALQSYRNFRTGALNEIRAVAALCATQYKQDVKNTNLCFQTKYKDFWNQKVNSLWPQAGTGCSQ